MGSLEAKVVTFKQLKNSERCECIFKISCLSLILEKQLDQLSPGVVMMSVLMSVLPLG